MLVDVNLSVFMSMSVASYITSMYVHHAMVFTVKFVGYGGKKFFSNLLC